ncbi:MAG: phytanoyl-CoA dioxygenase family protein [Alphaproteobacteria bacterium]|nr:phytanoyl-CoA dioxygenase family protein [Alphaproteobacteria bacterium]
MNCSSSNKEFQENGFIIVKNVISLPVLQQLKSTVFKSIKKCSEQLGIIEEDYLSVVSRWGAPSPITANVPSSLLNTLMQETKKIVGDSPCLSKLNIIGKNAYCTGAVPYHQDISYSPQEPYQLSAWLALHDVLENSGPLEVIPKSHLDPIIPAIDFWSPEFVPDLSLKKFAQKLLLAAGDIVFFDSRLWHGSSENKDLSPRYALVTRWTTKNWKPNQCIPPITPKFFGMWTSGQMTQNILAQGLQVFFDKKETDFMEIIDAWVKALEIDELPFYIDVLQVIENLKKIKILHLAFVRHNGGDATGTIYKNLWNSFLSPMIEHLPQIQKKRGAL